MANLAEKVSDVAKEKQAAPEKRRALGRGLESLLPGGPRVVAGSAVAPATVPKAAVPEAASPQTAASGADGASQLAPAPAAQTTSAGGAVSASPASFVSPASGAPVPSSPMAGLDRPVVRNEGIGAASTPGAGAMQATVHAPLVRAPEQRESEASAGSTSQVRSADTPAPPTLSQSARKDGAPSGSMGVEDLQGAADTDFDGVEVLELPLDRIDSNPYQTRHFTEEDEADLAELAVSIKAQGLIQPITVREGKNGRYILIAGDRRTRASRLAEKTTIPAIVWEVSEQQAAEMTIIENMMREDLNCMDQTRAFVLLSSKFHMTQAQIADRIGCSRESVSNYMRLARLPNELQNYLIDGRLEFSHARYLLKIEDEAVQLRVARKVVQEHIPVNDLEDLMLASNPTLLKPVEEKKKERGARWVDPNVRSAQRDLERVLGMRVRIRDRNNKGKIMIEYSTLEDFDRVVGMLKGK